MLAENRFREKNRFFLQIINVQRPKVVIIW